MPRAKNKGACPKESLVVTVDRLVDDGKPGSTIFEHEGIIRDCKIVGPLGHNDTSEAKNVDSRDKHAKSMEQQVVLDDVKGALKVYSDDSRLEIFSDDIPDLHEARASGGRRILSANPVFELKGKLVVKYVCVNDGSPAFFRALIHEVHALMSTCPYWVSPIGLFLKGGHLCIVMNKMTVMDTVAKAMRAPRKQMPDVVLATMLNDLLQGLEHLAKNGLVHGDIKPPNILLDASGRVVICDFGSMAMQCKWSEYKELYGLCPHTRCTLGYRLPNDITHPGMFIGTWFDMLSAGLSALEVALGDNPVFALLDGFSQEETEHAFTATLLDHPNLLQSLERADMLPKIKDTALRIVLQEMTKFNPDLRISPDKALELLATSVKDREQVREFVQGLPKQT